MLHTLHPALHRGDHRIDQDRTFSLLHSIDVPGETKRRAGHNAKAGFGKDQSAQDDSEPFPAGSNDPESQS